MNFRQLISILFCCGVCSLLSAQATDKPSAGESVPPEAGGPPEKPSTNPPAQPVVKAGTPADNNPATTKEKSGKHEVDPPVATSNPGKAPVKAPTDDWEKGITRVRLLESGMPVSVPITETLAKQAAVESGKIPKVVSPYPVKIMSEVPDGWQLYADPEVPATLQRVTYADGRVLEFAVTAPVLRPANPSATTIALPGSPVSLIQALAAARKSQAESSAALRALTKALAEQFPQAAPTPPPR